MDYSPLSSSDAAEVVLRERERERESAKQDGGSAGTAGDKVVEPELETVSVPRWEGDDVGEVDESELDRRQRALSQQLEQRQLEVQRQGRRLAKVREELKALEQPIKAEIMQLRESLEQANRKEIALVDAVNSLRKDLYNKEQSLKAVREEKQDLADSLIRVMADYEKRKTERLNEIAELVDSNSATSKPVKKPNFAGF